MELPKFKYNPDPITTGSVLESDDKCVCCGKVRGYIYTGPVYAEEEYEECICPWCIADGSAHDKLDASFSDEEGIGGYGLWDEVPGDVIEEIAYRTPGFCGWQQEQWWTHCGDGAEFLGRAGRDELLTIWSDAIDVIRDSTDLQQGPEWDQFMAALNKDGSPTAYIFRCTRCGKLGGYADFD